MGGGDLLCASFALVSRTNSLSPPEMFLFETWCLSGGMEGRGGEQKRPFFPSLSGLVRRRIANSIVGHQQYI